MKTTKPIASILIIMLSQLLLGGIASADWHQQIGGAARDQATNVAIDANGFVYTVGYFSTTISTPANTNIASNGGYDCFISKHTPDGTLVWIKSFGGAGDDIPYDIRISSDMALLICGEFESTVDFDPGIAEVLLSGVGQQDAFVMKLNMDGNLLWARQLSGTAVERAYTVSACPDNSLIVSGHFYETVDFDPSAGVSSITSTNSDIFVVKLNGSGELLWNKKIAGSSDEVVRDSVVSVLGDIYLTGYYYGSVDFNPDAGTAILSAQDSDEAFVVKLSPAGQFSWVKQIAGTGDQVGYAIDLDSEGNVVVGGHFFGLTDLDSGNGESIVSASGYSDIFLVKISSQGDTLWTRNIGGTDYDECFDLSIDEENNVLLVGRFRGTIPLRIVPPLQSLVVTGEADAIVVSLDPNGEIIAGINLGGAGNDYLSAIASANASSSVVVGNFESRLTFSEDKIPTTLDSYGSADALVMQITDPILSSAFHKWPASQNGNEHAYAFIVDTEITWPEAELAARALGGHLATITSQAEQDWLMSIAEVDSIPNHGYWFGLRESAVEGDWGWVTDEPLGYTNWYPGEPNNNTYGGNENASQIMINVGTSFSGKWNDIQEEGFSNRLEIHLNRGGYIVEIPLESEALALSISDFASNNCNGDVQLDVSVSNVTEAQPIDALGFSILYDTTKLSFEGIERSASVSNWFLLNANEIQPGRIVVAGLAVDAAPVAMDSSLLRVNFSWACDAEQCSTTLQLANLDSDLLGATTVDGDVTCQFTSEGEGTLEGEPARYSFSSSVVGNGSVSPVSGSVFEPGTNLTVTATPAVNWVFDHWEGDLSGATTPATLLMDADREVIAVFRPSGPRVITGTVTNSITGNPVEGAYVEISASIKALAFDTTDESGSFEFTVPENTGAVTLTVVLREYLPQILSYPSPPVVPVSVSLVPVGVSTPSTPIAYSGPRTVFIEWQANPEYNLKGYYVWRTPTDADGVPTGTSVKVSELISATEFQDLETSPGQHYRYQVQALSGADRPSSLSPSSDAVRAQFLTVFTPEITINNNFENLYLWDLTPQTLEDANWVRVPVSARSAYEISSSGMDIVVELPNSLLDVTPGADLRVETTGITDGMSVAANIPVTGELRISAFDLAPRTLFGSGVLFDVYLPKRDSTNCSPMTLVPDTFDGVSGRQGVRIYDDANPPLSVPLELENGTLCTTGGTCIHGDVNSDGVIDELDVRRILALKVGQFVLDECSAWAGDINLDRRVDSADAVMLDRWLNGIAINPPANKALSADKGFAGKLKEKDSGAPVVWIGELQGAASSLVQVPVYIRDASPISGYSAKFNFLAGTEGASFQSAQIAPGLSGFELRTVNQTEGVYGSVEIAAASTNPIGTDAVTQIVILTFKVGASAGDVKVPLSIAEFEGSDVFGLTPRHGAPGQVEIVVGANGTGGLEAVLLGDFDGFDTDRDGLLDEAEAAVSGLKQEIFDSLDANGDGHLQVSELIEAASGASNVHRADQNGDKGIDLGELLRVIQLYNAQGYGCAQNAGASEDGYQLGLGAAVQNCKPHTLDYEVQDWRISLSELLRLIQLYNLGSYEQCEAGEDGFCPDNR